MCYCCSHLLPLRRRPGVLRILSYASSWMGRREGGRELVEQVLEVVFGRVVVVIGDVYHDFRRGGHGGAFEPPELRQGWLLGSIVSREAEIAFVDQSVERR